MKTYFLKIGMAVPEINDSYLEKSLRDVWYHRDVFPQGGLNVW